MSSRPTNLSSLSNGTEKTGSTEFGGAAINRSATPGHTCSKLLKQKKRFRYKDFIYP